MALRSVSGTLAPRALLDDLVAPAAPAQLRAVLVAAFRVLGPASSARAIADLQVLPLLRAAGLDASMIEDDAGSVVGAVGEYGHTPAASLCVGRWGADLRRLRDGVPRALRTHRWWIGANGVTLRVVDADRAFTRRALDFDLRSLLDEDAALAVLEKLLSPEGGRLRRLDGLVALAARHHVDVGRSLHTGVESALSSLVAGFASGRRRHDPDRAFGDALTVVYRILFLLFAEARGLVPRWHPVYRNSYTIESLRGLAESGRAPVGLWDALQAISRLAHRGCSAGTLRVVPFNGRLFAPSSAPLADTFRLDDRVARDVLLAVTTRRGADRRERISYADLGVEQLGAVYERVLDFAPGVARRKPTGTFYTPRSMTEFLVRRTLAPLVQGRSAADILALRVLDPAMGSGAFLVAACRFLAEAYEHALVAEGSVADGEIGLADRAGFRRAVAQRCLYGVDSNPTAVQLARLSLWLCTLSSDRPLTFLDHHLRTGNSLIGARLDDVMRQPPGCARRRTPAVLPLFDDLALPRTLASTVTLRTALTIEPDDSADVVHRKERTIDAMAGPAGELSPWRETANAWCAAWFWPESAPRPNARTWPAFAAALRGRAPELPEALVRTWRETAATIAAERRFFHWDLEFPEVFFDEHGAPRPDAGFDAVVGNPPWADANALAAFARQSGCYVLQGGGHANLYQLFAERMLRLTAAGGRVGMLMPAGLLADVGSTALRRHLFERCRVDAVLGYDNRDALFPIHRGLKFSLITATVTATHQGTTGDVQARFGLHAAETLEDIPDDGPIPGAVRVPMTLIRRFGGEDLAMPEVATAVDLAIAARMLSAAPPLADANGWQARFGRELNATDDRGHFGPAGLPVLEGKHLEPFEAHVDRAVQFIDSGAAATLLGPRAGFMRARVAYREVASSTNRLTLIAAVIPAGAVTTHTVFCLRQVRGRTWDEELQWYLCAVFNSYAANYLVRLRGATHVPAAAIHRLPVPLCTDRVVGLTAGLAREAARDAAARADLQGRCARAYGLDAAQFARVLETFPLVPAAEREAALAAFFRARDAI